MQLGKVLPVGTIEVTFTAFSPVNDNTTASCTLKIEVLDKEKPSMTQCPENMEYTLQMYDLSRRVYWTEPHFYDNVGVISVYRSKQPGDKFERGLHHITYIASDVAGNRAYCYFTVNLRGNEYKLFRKFYYF